MQTVVWTITTALVVLGDGQPVQLSGSYQVLQRNSEGVGACVIPLPPSLVNGESLALRIFNGDLVVFEKTVELTDAAENMGMLLSGIPTGGPYAIVLTNGTESLRFEQICVGDLWVLAGQSNMQGAAPLKVVDDPIPGINMLNMDNLWKPGTPPLHRLIESDAPVIKGLIERNWGQSPEERARLREESKRGPGVGGVGCGFFFAQTLLEETDVPIGLIPCAFGGTALNEWSPDRRHHGDASLYGHMINRIHRVGGTVRGILWYQGESDAMNTSPSVHGTYFERFQTFVEAVRGDCNAPDLPIITAQIGRVVVYVSEDSGPHWEAVREAQRQIAIEIPHVHMVATVDLPLSDGIHISYEGQELLGERMAWLAQPYADDTLPPRQGIALASVRFANPERTTIHVDFDHVSGALTSHGLARGFGLGAQPKDRPRERFFHTGFDPDFPNRVILYRGEPMPEEARLWYGFDLNPVANIVDEYDRPIPAFGPVPIDAM